ncbi:MAG: hypothetical protein VX529_10985 [Pseudomonadota bacterium]|nr:hypothetical protein [Pseudomonadota bacterium]
MPDWRDFGTSKVPGIKRYWRDDGNGGGEILSAQDVGAVLERNKVLANHNDGYSPSREMRRAGSVPYLTLYKWIAEAGLEPNDPDFQDKVNKLILRKLDDSDYRYLRTAPGRLT